MRRALVALLATLLTGICMPVAPALAAAAAKVVIIVGPAGDSTAHYRSDANALATEALRYTPNVVKLYTPNATWANVKAAAQGASILVYLGHGNGWPSPYAPFQVLTKDGLGLDPSTGADGTKVVYYGEQYLRDSIRLAPNSVVLLYHLCYASGNTEPGMATGTLADSKLRVDNYGAGFIGAGARAVIADGHPDTQVVDYIRQLFTTNRSIDTIFRSAANWHGHPIGPFASQRTPGLKYLLDSDTTAPSGFYRSVVGDLALTAGAVTGAPPAPTNTDPTDYVMPGAAEVVATAGAPMFATAEDAANPAATPTRTMAAGTHLRILSEAAPAADGTRVLGGAILATAINGYMRASDITPRDSASILAWTLDQSAALLSPNADGVNDGLVVATRFSEPASITLTVKNGAGTTVLSTAATGDIARISWDLRDGGGVLVPDGAYTWTLKTAKDAWGNLGPTITGTFTVDGTAPVSKAALALTAGGDGWSRGPVSLTITSQDATSGVAAVHWRVDGAAAALYAAPVSYATDGIHTVEYRAIDRAGIREVWRPLTVKVDATPPTVTLALTGTAGELPNTWRGPVTITPATDDATSGVAGRTVAVDGGAPAALAGTSVTVSGDGPHTVTVTVKDVAGNPASATAAFSIDATAPLVTMPAAPAGIPTVSPNGDGAGEQVSLPYSSTEGGVRTATISNSDGSVVRVLEGTAGTGPGTVTWDGRDAAGAPVPDGRYSLALTVRDAVGNTSEAVTATVDVYAALGSLARSPGLFFPQDGDTLATTTTVTFTLHDAATAGVTVLDQAGAVVRTGLGGAALPAGPASWTWDGTRDDGAPLAPGTYRVVVTATNGEQAATLSTTVLADAFRIATSAASATRGTPITVTATTAEPLSMTPRLVVRQPGIASWTVTMTKVSATRWSAVISPKSGGTAGTLTLQVKAFDTDGGTNSSIVRMELR